MELWGGRRRTVLVMWEHGCEHSPIWSRCVELDVGDVDARSLGLTEDLRDDLASWNRRCEGDAAAPQARRALTGESFPLAARVQRQLGDDWTVWCLSGGGDGGLRDGFEHEARTSGVPIVLRSGGPVAWTPTGVAPALDRFEPGLRRDLHAWRGAADRLPPAEHRAQALELCGRMHAALPAGRVLWYGGDPPA